MVNLPPAKKLNFFEVEDSDSDVEKDAVDPKTYQKATNDETLENVNDFISVILHKILSREDWVKNSQNK